MTSQQSQLIKIEQEYPCPCRCHGRLVNIAMTEAFGCFKCQQIFVVTDGGHAIAKLIANTPQRQLWQWTGHEWCRAPRPWSSQFLGGALILIGMVLALVLLLALRPPPLPWQMLAWLVGGLMLMVLLSIWCALANRFR